MLCRPLQLGRWYIEFYFAPDGYDVDELLSRLYDFGARSRDLRDAESLMMNGRYNTGFAFANPWDMIGIIAIGPTSSGEEFIDTLVHEVHHFAVSAAVELGADLREETPAYISGDTARELSDVICALGCNRCA